MDRHDDAPSAVDDLRDLRLVPPGSRSSDVRERRAVILSGRAPRFARRAAWASAILHLLAAVVVAVALHRSDDAIVVPVDFHITLQGRVTAPAPPSPSPPAPTPAPPTPPVAQATRVTQPVVKPVTKGAIVPKPDRAERAAVRPPTPGQEALSAPASGSRSTALSSNEVRVGPGGGVTGNFPFAYYLNGVRAAIQRNWSPPRGAASAGALDATVRFAIARDGSVSDVVVEERSGVSSFDEAAATAVRRAAPFAALPRAYAHDDLVVHMGFHYDE
jgi:protein TonB